MLEKECAEKNKNKKNIQKAVRVSDFFLCLFCRLTENQLYYTMISFCSFTNNKIFKRASTMNTNSAEVHRIEPSERELFDPN